MVNNRVCPVDSGVVSGSDKLKEVELSRVYTVKLNLSSSGGWTGW